MNANQEYEDLFRNTFQQIRAARLRARSAAQIEWDQRVATEAKRLKLKKKDTLPPEVADEIRKEVYQKFKLNELDEELDAAQEVKETRLCELASLVRFEPDPTAWWIAKKSSAYTYGSQTQPGFYARGSLLGLQWKLEGLGFQTNIQFKNGYDYCESSLYILWSDAPDWQADAASRLLTLNEWLNVCNKNALNPRVYMPFLPWSLTP